MSGLDRSRSIEATVHGWSQVDRDETEAELYKLAGACFDAYDAAYNDAYNAAYAAHFWGKLNWHLEQFVSVGMDKDDAIEEAKLCAKADTDDMARELAKRAGQEAWNAAEKSAQA